MDGQTDVAAARHHAEIRRIRVPNMIGASFIGDADWPKLSFWLAPVSFFSLRKFFQLQLAFSVSVRFIRNPSISIQGTLPLDHRSKTPIVKSITSPP